MKMDLLLVIINLSLLKAVPTLFGKVRVHVKFLTRSKPREKNADKIRHYLELLKHTCEHTPIFNSILFPIVL